MAASGQRRDPQPRHLDRLLGAPVDAALARFASPSPPGQPPGAAAAPHDGSFAAGHARSHQPHEVHRSSAAYILPSARRPTNENIAPTTRVQIQGRRPARPQLVAARREIGRHGRDRGFGTGEDDPAFLLVGWRRELGEAVGEPHAPGRPHGVTAPGEQPGRIVERAALEARHPALERTEAPLKSSPYTAITAAGIPSTGGRRRTKRRTRCGMLKAKTGNANTARSGGAPGGAADADSRHSRPTAGARSPGA